MIELRGKKILLMGASGFIGKTTALLLSELGAELILSGRDGAKLREVSKLLRDRKHYFQPYDLNQLNGLMLYMQEIVNADNKKLSGFVYCPAIYPIRPLKSTTPAYLQEVFQTNYFAFIEAIRCFSDKRICDGGSVVALSSIASTHGEKGQLAYSASKAAMDSSIVVLSKELKTKGIRVNSIRPAALLPGHIEISDLPQSIQETICCMKTGPIEVRNVAEHIAFLLSDLSIGISGSCFDVRGYLA